MQYESQKASGIISNFRDMSYIIKSEQISNRQMDQTMAKIAEEKLNQQGQSLSPDAASNKGAIPFNIRPEMSIVSFNATHQAKVSDFEVN